MSFRVMLLSFLVWTVFVVWLVLSAGGCGDDDVSDTSYAPPDCGTKAATGELCYEDATCESNLCFLWDHRYFGGPGICVDECTTTCPDPAKCFYVGTTIPGPAGCLEPCSLESGCEVGFECRLASWDNFSTCFPTVEQ